MREYKGRILFSITACLMTAVLAASPVFAAETASAERGIAEESVETESAEEEAPKEESADEVLTGEEEEEGFVRSEEESESDESDEAMVSEAVSDFEEDGESSASESGEASSESAYADVHDYVQTLSFVLEGDTAVLKIYGYRQNEWQYPLCDQVDMYLSYSDGSREKINLNYGYTSLHGTSYRTLSTDVDMVLSGSNYATTTIRIPMTALQNDTGISIQADSLSASLAVSEGGEASEEPHELSEYGQDIGGVVDWSEVKMTLLNSAGTNNAAQGYPPRCAWKLSPDGETVYIYLENVVDWSGLNSTGNFDIKTDTNRTFVFRILNGRVYVGTSNQELSGVTFIGDRNQGSYEIPVPVSMLPTYLKTISFGYDHEDPVLTGLEIGGGAAEADPDEFGVSSIDGNYAEWQSYPVSRLDYSGAGTQTASVEGECALINTGDYILGYCDTVFNAHAANAYDAATITLYNRLPDASSRWSWQNGDLGFRYAMVDEKGKMTWLNSGSLMAITGGTTELYIFGLDAWGNSTNINNLSQGDTCYGKLFVTVQEDGSRSQIEFYVDAEKYGERYGMSASEIRTVASEYIRIGGYTTAAGTSTYPLAGALILLFIAIAGYYITKEGMPSVMLKEA